MNDFTLLLPEFLVAGLAFAVLTADLLVAGERKHLLPLGAVVGLVAIGAFTLWFLWGEDSTLYEGAVRVDGYALFFKVFLMAIGGFAILGSIEYVRRNLDHPGEYYGVLLFTIVGMMLMAAAGELLTAYIGLELLSFGLYVLVAYDRYNPKSNEAGTKYILLGAFSSALLLYGISQVYGLLGTTRFDEIGALLSATPELSPGLILGLALIIAGLGFKVAAVPFHMWAPDAYEGAPTPVTAYLAVGSKVAAFALILRLFSGALIPAATGWQPLMAILAAATMVFGNVVALAQSNIKRLLAYSSIGHVGYLLLGIAALSATSDTPDAKFAHLASNGVLFHLVAYSVTNMAVFLVVGTVYNATGKEEITDFAGMARRAPMLALVMTAALFSLAGLPIFAGFTSKFYLFNAAATQGLLWLSGLAIFASLISLYYYLQVIRQMYVEPAGDASPIRIPRLTVAVLGTLFAGVLLLGVYPAPLLEAVQYATGVIVSADPGAIAATLD